jgi:transposase
MPSQEVFMALAWQDATVAEQTRAFGGLALIAPLLQRLGLADIIDGHLPPDPQLEFPHGRVLSLLLAARLCQPTALVNIATWAEATGADLLWDIPADSLNDDRLGRALDAFFTQRHSIQATIAAEALRLAELSPQRLHFDTTHLIFYGDYAASRPRPDNTPWPPRSSAGVPPAHITHGYAADEKLIHVGITAAIDDLGALPILGQCLDGNHNNHTAIHQQSDWLLDQGLLSRGALLVSDRGTFSVEHVARLHRHGCHVLCSAPWADYQALYVAQAGRLNWQRASFLSVEQQRRREVGSSLPREHYDLAVVRHTLTDPETDQPIPCRVIFVYSSADGVICRQTREQDVARLRAGLEEIAASVGRGHPRTTQASVARRVAELFGRRAAARFFRWEMVPLTTAEQAALPEPSRGCRRPAYRFTFAFDAAAAAAAAAYDGLSVLVTTAPRGQSADALFTQFKEQNYVELSHHQWKTPLAVRPVFLKSSRRVEALVCLMQLALTAYQLLERFYRQSTPEGATAAERRRTAESLLREFRGYGLIERRTRLGRVVRATRLTWRQQQILCQLGFPSPAQLLAQVLPPLPLG